MTPAWLPGTLFECEPVPDLFASLFTTFSLLVVICVTVELGSLAGPLKLFACVVVPTASVELSSGDTLVFSFEAFGVDVGIVVSGFLLPS